MKFLHICFLFIPCWFLVAETPRAAENNYKWYGEQWGVETNGIRAGLYINYGHKNSSTNKTLISCTPVLENTQTNWVTVWLPSIESQYQLTMSDEQGNPIAKTAKGQALGKPITQPLRMLTGINYRAGYKERVLVPKQVQMFSDQEFDLQDYFSLTNSGRYRLRFEMRVVWFPPGWTGNTTKLPPPTIALPPVAAEIEIISKAP